MSMCESITSHLLLIYESCEEVHGEEEVKYVHLLVSVDLVAALAELELFKALEDEIYECFGGFAALELVAEDTAEVLQLYRLYKITLCLNCRLTVALALKPLIQALYSVRAHYVK